MQNVVLVLKVLDITYR